MPKVTKTTEPAGVSAVLSLRQSGRGGSGSFLVAADDGRRYWCKVLNNPQHPRVPVNEQIAGRLGSVLGIATCEVALVKIPDALAGWEFRPGQQLATGWAHGSLAIDGVTETHSLDHRSADENARRHAGFFALYDWLAGSDPQWLVAPADDNRYYSHDHGHYFQGPAWSIQSLQQQGGSAFQLGGPTTRLDPTELERLAGAIEGLTGEEIAGCLANLPVEWPVEEDELDALLSFLLNRRGPVGERLRAMIGAA